MWNMQYNFTSVNVLLETQLTLKSTNVYADPSTSLDGKQATKNPRHQDLNTYTEIVQILANDATACWTERQT
jgi:hypothetical protein